MAFGSGKYTYEVIPNFGKLPSGWEWGWIPAVACDSQDNVYVYSRSKHPLVIFDRDGNFLDSWGEDVLEDAHGIYIDAEDNVWCTERETHCIRKFNNKGELTLTIGTPHVQGANDGDPFRLPTDLAIAADGSLLISDGYGNARVHKYTHDGQLITSWGSWGTGPSQFELSHCVRIDRHDQVWICDRTNNRIQIFDTAGNFRSEWAGLYHPDTIYFDPIDPVVYIAEMDQQISIYTLERELLSQWGGREKSAKPGEFIAYPHGIWADSHGDLYVGEVQADGRLQKFVRL